MILLESVFVEAYQFHFRPPPLDFLRVSVVFSVLDLAAGLQSVVMPVLMVDYVRPACQLDVLGLRWLNVVADVLESVEDLLGSLLIMLELLHQLVVAVGHRLSDYYSPIN